MERGDHRHLLFYARHSIPFRPDPNIRIRITRIPPKTRPNRPIRQSAYRLFGRRAQIHLTRLLMLAERFTRSEGPVALGVNAHVHEPFHALLHRRYLDSEFAERGPDDEVDNVDVGHEELVGRGAEPFWHCFIG